MPRVDFYLLADAAPGTRLRTACRLAEKAYQQGHRVYMYVPAAADATELDDLLWTFGAGSFVPHEVARSGPAGSAPVLLGTEEPASALNDVLINLRPEVPACHARFARVIEIVSGTEDDKARARERFRAYREQGSEPHTHQLE